MKSQGRLLLHMGLLGLAQAHDDKVGASDWTWDALTPKPDLEYHDCYGGFQCARLQLPLDWKNTSDARTVAIAVIKLPARVADDDATFGGSIFTNPGGPGGSGVDLLVGRGRALQDYVDRPGKRHYEMVSFDPRGVANSRPLANCYPGAMLARDAFALESRGLPGTFQDDAAVAYTLALEDGFGHRCEAAEKTGANGGDIFGFMGTPSVARDMVEMVDKIDDWRKKHAATDNNGMRPELRKRANKHDDDDVPRLQYIGFSYGTVLGNFFASLFPERVGRLVLDGVVNSNDFSSGDGWLSNTVDADAIIDGLFSGCFEAGPDQCALARPDDKAAAAIRTRVWNWIDHLDKAPITGLSRSGGSIILTGNDIRVLLGMAAYTPLQSFRIVARTLDDAMRGHKLQDVFSLVEQIGYGGPLQSACPLPNQPAFPDLLAQGVDGQHAVVCGDGTDLTSRNASWWQAYQAKQIAQSSVMGQWWTTIRLPCSRWRLKSNWVFRGPFTSPEPSRKGKVERGRPAAPLLFLSNRLDPVTPLRAARTMAAQHPGAKVVVQEAMGHCAVGSAFSQCTKDIVARYFDSGEVPDEETSCETECGPWDVECSGAWAETWHTRRFPLAV